MQVSGIFFKAVVQVVILFGLETWVTNPHMGRDLGGFQYMMARRITQRHPQQIQNGIWEYPPPPLEEAIREAVLEEMEVCVCSGLRTRMAFPNDEVVRIGTGVLQPGFQPRTVANPALDSRRPTRII